MGAALNAVIAMLNSPDFGEMGKVLPAGSPSNTPLQQLTVRIRREPVVTQRSERETIRLHKYELKFLATVDAVLGGLVNPTNGDTWSLPLVKGGALQAGFQAGAPEARDGYWLVPVQWRERFGTGGERKAGNA